MSSATAGLVALGLVLVGLASFWWLLRRLIRPLRRVTDAACRLASGDPSARAPLTGPAELQRLAGAINTQAEAAERLRAQEAERSRLMLTARQTVQRIRQHLRVEDLMHEARVAIEEHIDADTAYLHMIRDNEIGPPEGHEHDWIFPPDFLKDFPQAITRLHDLLARQASLIVQDVQGPEGDQFPPQIREPLRAAGVASHLLTPFGTGPELLGIIAAERLRPGRPWSSDEVDAVQWIAADLAHGLRQARTYEAENRLVKELQSVDRAKSDFLATVSHELRTPLTSIAGFVELLGDQTPGPLTTAQLRMLETVDRNTARLRRLIEDLLTLSKIESGAFRTVMEPVDLAGIVAESAATLRPQAEAKDLVLTTAVRPSSVPVDGDPGQLERILLNLLSNAVKFTPPGGLVAVTATAEDAHAVLRVSDTGIGIPEQDQEDLSSRFFRASNAVERSIPGTGLGLTIVRSIVANHGGQMDLRSQEGQGTTVTIRIALRAVGDDAARPLPRMTAPIAAPPFPAEH